MILLTRPEFQSLYEQGFEVAWTVLETLQTTLLTQQAQIETLTARVQELENRLGKDSHNSNKPPSSDGLAKKPVSLRKPSGRKPGGQPGHKRDTLSFSETPDALVLHSSPAVCAVCQASLETVAQQEGERRQVVDLPPPQLVVTEHHTPCKACPACGHKNPACFSAEVSQRVQYGSRTAALGGDKSGQGRCVLCWWKSSKRSGRLRRGAKVVVFGGARCL